MKIRFLHLNRKKYHFIVAESSGGMAAAEMLLILKHKYAWHICLNLKYLKFWPSCQIKATCNFVLSYHWHFTVWCFLATGGKFWFYCFRLLRLICLHFIHYWPTRPRPNKWSLFSHMVSVRLSVRKTKTRYNANVKYTIQRAPCVKTMRTYWLWPGGLS